LFFLGGAVMGLTAFLAIPQKHGGVKLWLPEEECQLVAH
jgi:hypothetical protein